MLNLRRDQDGFIHVGRHFPTNMSIAITFTDGTRGEFSSARLNELYTRPWPPTPGQQPRCEGL
ncbi:hypothetical protein [Arthrobacter sp. A5]|uniref:hypothetical protein n=1 Tax=Arthrobacter sp. A5 TaxID=576926 RepID=UPI003DA8461C